MGMYFDGCDRSLSMLVIRDGTFSFHVFREASLVSYNTIITLSCLAMALKDEQNARQTISARFQQCLADAPPAIDRLIIDQLGRLLMSSLVSLIGVCSLSISSVSSSHKMPTKRSCVFSLS